MGFSDLSVWLLDIQPLIFCYLFLRVGKIGSFACFGFGDWMCRKQLCQCAVHFLCAEALCMTDSFITITEFLKVELIGLPLCFKALIVIRCQLIRSEAINHQRFPYE